MLRTIGKIIFSIFLIISLLGTFLILGLANFTTYDNLKPNIVGFVLEMIEDDSNDLEGFHNSLAENCTETGSEMIAININENDSQINSIEVKCSDVLNLNASDFEIIFVEALFDKVYYLEYDCDRMECLEKYTPQFLFSKNLHDFFTRLSTYFIIISFILILFLLFLNKLKSKIFINLGIVSVIVGILLFLLKNNFVNLLSENPQFLSLMSGFNSFVFISSLILLALGLVFLIFGIMFVRKSNMKQKSEPKI